MKKFIVLVIALIIVVSAIAIFLNYKNKFKDINANVGNNINNFEECLKANYIILESYPRQCKTPNGQTFVEDIGNTLIKDDLINLTNPLPNQAVTSPLSIEGKARGSWYFEASFPVKLYDENNNLIASTVAQAQSDWMTNEFVSFKAELNFNYSTSTNGILVLEKDNPSGLPENADQLRIPVEFSSQVVSEKMKVKVFFNNNKLDPEISCNRVFPVEREVIKTPAVARAALEELLKGVNELEDKAGYFSSLNSNIKIQSLTIENGVAKVDFDKQLEAQVGGSCKVGAIRAQISETLKQFSSVKNVIISIDGRSEDILQP